MSGVVIAYRAKTGEMELRITVDGSLEYHTPSTVQFASLRRSARACARRLGYAVKTVDAMGGGGR